MSLNQNSSKKLFSFIGLVFALGIGLQAPAAELCSNIWKTPVPIGALRPEFRHSTQYTKELSQTRITNQCNLGTCHLYSWTNNLEASYLRNNNKELLLSSDYLSYVHFREAVKRAFHNTEKKTDIKFGANVVDSFKYVKQYGLFPEEAWNVGTHFKMGTLSSQARALFKNYIARVQLELKKTEDPVRREKLLKRRSAEVDKMFDEMFGEIPKTFEFEGKTYTPREFADSHFPELKKKIEVYEIVKNEQAVRSEETPPAIDSDLETPIVKTITVNLQPSFVNKQKLAKKNLGSMIMAKIDQGKNIYLTYHHKHELTDAQTGIMSIQAWNIPRKLLPLSKEKRDLFEDLNGGGHAVQIVGYEKDPQSGELLKVKIKNSWGDKKGDLGYYHMYADYLHTFGYGIITIE